MYALTYTQTQGKCWWGCDLKRNPYSVDGNVNWYGHYRKQYGDYSKT